MQEGDCNASEADRAAAPPGMQRAERMTSPGERAITVSLPYFRCRPFLRRAVESILGQTHGDLTLIVMNDGETPEPWDLLADIKDSRLVRFDLDANRGRYFADAVALAATPDQYFMVQDADDWSSVDRGALLYEILREENADAAFSAVNEYRGERCQKLSYTKCTEAPLPQLSHIAYHFGLYRARALRAIGGYYGGFRFGYDLLLVGLLSLTGRLAYVDVPLYHHDIREGSLRTSFDTGLDSAARQEVRVRISDLYDQAYRGFREYVAGHRSLDDLRRLTAALVSANVAAQDAHALDVQSARLRGKFDRRVASRRRCSRPSASPNGPTQERGGAPQLTRLGRPGNPDISVVMPTRYDTSALPSTIGSFMATRSRNTRLEFVIVDDASPDGVDGATFEQLFDMQRQNASIVVVRPDQHVGITRGRNLGARYARADRLFITDAHVKVEHGWDAMVAEYAQARRVLAATIASDETGGRGFGASLEMPCLTIRWNSEPAGDAAAVHVAASSGMVVDRKLYRSLGGFDSGMILYGSAGAEFSIRAWLSGAEVLNLPDLVVWHRFRSAEERQQTLIANLHFVLHNRLRLALLYLPDDLVLQIVRDMATHYPGRAVAQACDLVASSDVWRRRSLLRERELLPFRWFSRKFGLEIPGRQRITADV
jgi:glycosyltransferase involved in cell wall biosynthesis